MKTTFAARALRPLWPGCFLIVLLAGCVTTGSPQETVASEIAQPGYEAASACPTTEPIRATPPEDAAVLDDPQEGDYFVNADRSIWASAWWVNPDWEEEVAPEQDLKVGWFRPAGAALEITGQRLDGDAPPLESHVPCCYETRFQATGLYFPTPGCWEVSARANKHVIQFTVFIAP